MYAREHDYLDAHVDVWERTVSYFNPGVTGMASFHEEFTAEEVLDIEEKFSALRALGFEKWEQLARVADELLTRLQTP